MTDREDQIFRNAAMIAETRSRQGRRLQSEEMARLVRTLFRALFARRAPIEPVCKYRSLTGGRHPFG